MVADYETDVLVVGGGLAGLRAAEAASGAGARVTVVAKRPVGEGGASARASGGFAAATGPEDSAALHLADILSGGFGVNDRKLAELIATSAPGALSELNGRVGGFPQTAGGSLQGRPAPAHSAARSVQYPLGMSQLLLQLKEQLVAGGVLFLENHVAADWVFDQARAIAGLSLLVGESVVEIASRAVVIAAGGCGQLFAVTSNGPDMTGDGYALALRAGSALRDMEFIQYTPTAFAAPALLRGQTIVGTLLTEPGVCLLNSGGERFMERYDPERLERADRATLARAIYREISDGRGTANGGVYIDATSLPADEFNRHRPGFYDTCVQNGIDPAREPLETAPSAHTCLGGIAVDARLQAAPHLFAAGEALGGTHGANRLSSDSLTEANVTGWLAGKQAAESALSRTRLEIPAGQHEKTTGPAEVQFKEKRAELVSLMGQAAGVERDGAALEDALGRIAQVASHGRRQDNAVSRAGLELANMALCAEAVLASALVRKESRGAHFRRDYPVADDASWLGNVFVRSESNELKTGFRPL